MKKHALVLLLSLSFLLVFGIVQFSRLYGEKKVEYDTTNLPVVSIFTDKSCFKMGLDLGASATNIYSHKLTKNFVKTNKQRKFIDIFQNEYVKQVYHAPKFYWLGKAFNNHLICEEEPDFNKNTTFFLDHDSKQNHKEYLDGRIGRDIALRDNVLLNFPKDKIIRCNSQLLLKFFGYNINQWIKIPFFLTNYGITLKIKTDFGTHTVILDTGSTYITLKGCPEGASLLKRFEAFTPYLETQSLEIGSFKDFYTWEIFIIDQDFDNKEYDGLLGMDFLEDYEIYIDMKEMCLYLNPEDVFEKDSF